jgi:hypothetical protein
MQPRSSGGIPLAADRTGKRGFVPAWQRQGGSLVHVLGLDCNRRAVLYSCLIVDSLVPHRRRISETGGRAEPPFASEPTRAVRGQQLVVVVPASGSQRPTMPGQPQGTELRAGEARRPVTLCRTDTQHELAKRLAVHSVLGADPCVQCSAPLSEPNSLLPMCPCAHGSSRQ